jgi:hypothetical protein
VFSRVKIVHGFSRNVNTHYVDNVTKMERWDLVI